MSLMGSRGHTIYLCIIFLYVFSSLVSALDTMTASDSIQEPDTLSSNNTEFKLGFFNPPNSTNYYVGIWYLSKSAVVWVANRNEPLKDSSGVVTISEEGNLVILNSQKKVIWSTNVSNSNIMASGSVLLLLDSGNLVLKDKTTGKLMWESFQHPCNTLLPNMKLTSNAETGEKMKLTSWKSPSDPSVGSFSGTLELRNVPEVFIWKNNLPFWRRGPWNGQVFTGVPGMTNLYLSGFNIVKEEDGTAYLSFEYANLTGLSLTFFVLNPGGRIEHNYWDDNKKEWEACSMPQESLCDIYGFCGSFSTCDSRKMPICSCLRGFEPKNAEEWYKQNWTSGCVRRKALQCDRVKNGDKNRKEDGFLLLENTKAPDFLSWSTTLLGDCRTQCLNYCSCIAYAYDAGIGCMFWSRDLIDIQIFSKGGVDLLIRVANSELVMLHFAEFHNFSSDSKLGMLNTESFFVLTLGNR